MAIQHCKSEPDTKPYECVISGQSFHTPGSIRDCTIGALDRASGRRIEGVITNVGPVASTHLPVYEAAVNDFSFGGERLGNIKTHVRTRLADSEFVSGVLMERSREAVFSILDSIDSVYGAHREIREFRDYLMRGIRTKSYISGKYDGKGLGLLPAWGCMNDDVRTAKFLKAEMGALERLEYKDSLEVVDAGAGPLPIFGIIAALKSDKANVTCIEVNPESAAMAKRVVSNLGLEGRIKIVCEDATTYVHEKEIDLLISETMYSGLLNGEEMIDILGNLSAQTSHGGEIIPRVVTVNAGVVSVSRSGAEVNAMPLRRVYEYSSGESVKDEIRFAIDLTDLEPGNCRVTLSSDVVLDDDSILEEHDSHITRPVSIPIAIDFAEDRGGDVLVVSYLPGQKDEDVKMEYLPKDEVDADLLL